MTPFTWWQARADVGRHRVRRLHGRAGAGLGQAQPRRTPMGSRRCAVARGAGAARGHHLLGAGVLPRRRVYFFVP
ncbi:MAG: hypothetical protein MZW92_69330 [Comamonadaceae bacterium]|nr:hypothetical protein [Comamonadaceae bacterium]